MQKIFTRAILACFFLANGPLCADLAIPVAQDFSRDVVAMREQVIPMLVLFDTPDCSYCRQVEKGYLEPMQNQGARGRKLLFRVVGRRSAANLRDFDGNQTSHRAFAHQHRVTFTPTVMLFDAKGVLVAPPLVGLNPEFYGAYLEQTIEEARKKLGEGS